MSMTLERLAQILLANEVTSPHQLEQIAQYVLCQRIQPAAADCPSRGDGSDALGLFGSGNIGAQSSITINDTTCVPGYDIRYVTGLTALYFPNLVSVDPTDEEDGYITLSGNTTLTTLEFPELEWVSWGIDCSGCTTLVSLDLPSLEHVGGGGLDFSNCTLLRNVSMPQFLPQDGSTISFKTCNLSQASVDHILARGVANPAFVTGGIVVDAGTNSPPTSTGPGSDYAVLIARGVAVSVN